MAETKLVPGVVTNVASGDTMYVDGVGCIRLAGVQTQNPDTTYYGWQAQEYSCYMLMGTVVYLDLNGGTDEKGCQFATVYLSGPDGKANLKTSFNNLVLQGGYGAVYTGPEPPENRLKC
jgi:endonuclease YncB( thermonuclease family)